MKCISGYNSSEGKYLKADIDLNCPLCQNVPFPHLAIVVLLVVAVDVIVAGELELWHGAQLGQLLGLLGTVGSPDQGVLQQHLLDGLPYL